MAVPKKRVGKSAQGHRRSNWKATVPETTKCKNCGEVSLAHTVCTACGYYKGKVVSIKAEGFVEEVKTPKKTTRKSKKTEVKETKATPEVNNKAVEEKTETVAENVEKEENVIEAKTVEKQTEVKEEE